MNIAMMGLIKGFAKGTSARIDEERAEEKTLIANRLKMAALNKKQREEEAATKKEAAKARLDQVQTLFPGASLEQQLALISNESMFEIAVEQKKKTGDLNLDEFIVVNKDKIPADFKTAQDYVNSITARPKGEAKMPDMQTREVFFSKVTPDERQIEAMASQYGSKAADLFAYEDATTPITAPVFGSVNLESLKKKKTIDDRMGEASTSYADAVSQYGKDSAEAAAAKNAYDSLKDMKETLDPDEANWASYVGSLKMAIMNAKTPDEKRAAEKEYDRVLAIEARGKKEDSKIPTANTLANLFSRTAARALAEKFGAEYKDDLIIETMPDGSSTFRYIGTDEAKRKAVYDYSRSVIKDMVAPYLDKEGRPINTDVATALRSMLIPFDEQGRPIFVSVTPPPAAPGATEKPKVALPPGQGAAPPAAPAKTEQERILEKMSKADREAKEWADKNIDSPVATEKLMAEQILQNLKEKYPGIQ